MTSLTIDRSANPEMDHLIRQQTQGSSGFERIFQTATHTTDNIQDAAGNRIERGVNWTSNHIQTCNEFLFRLALRVMTAFEKAALFLHNKIALAGAQVGLAVYVAAEKTAYFIKNNWPRIIVYLCAFGVIGGASGLLYGFQAMTLPLSIGVGVGIGVGGIAGALVAKIFDPNEKWEYDTVWDWINAGIEKLGEHGVKHIAQALAVSLLIHASVVYPYAIGGLFGFLIGNHVVTKIAFRRPLGPDQARIENRIDTIARQQEALQNEQRNLTISLLHAQRQQQHLLDAIQRAQTEIHMIRDHNRAGALNRNLQTAAHYLHNLEALMDTIHDQIRDTQSTMDSNAATLTLLHEERNSEPDTP